MENIMFKDLLNSLAYAEGEQEVDKIYNETIKKIPGFKFNPLGDTEGSFAVISNLNTNPIRSFAELIKNSEDHTLIRACLEKGIDPKGVNAPEKPEKACELFFGIKDGDLSKLKRSELKKIYNESMINIIFTGRSKEDVNINIVDKGEGVNGPDFPKTLLSINKSNKRNIPFVLGEFGQGSHGVSRFCNYRLIVSRRPTELGGDGNYAFTLIKKMIPDNNEDRSWWGYLTINGEIPVVERTEEFLILPKDREEISFSKKDSKERTIHVAEPYKLDFKTGTFIKLYSYDLPSKLKSNCEFLFNYELIKYFFKVFVPFRIWETRSQYQTADSNHRDHYGLNTRYSITSYEKIIEGYPRSFKLLLGGDLGEVLGTLVVFNHKLLYVSGHKASLEHNKSEPIMFSVGGMHQGSLSESFFLRSSVGLSNLKDTLFINLDLTNIPTRYLEKLLMADRERIVTASNIYKLIEDKLTDFLNSDGDLKIQDHKRYLEIVNNRSDGLAKDYQESLKEAISKIPALRQLLQINNGGTIIPANSGKKGKKVFKEEETDDPPPPPSTFQGTYNPTILTEVYPMVDLPLNRRRSIFFKTDLANGQDHRVSVTTSGDLDVGSSSIHDGYIRFVVKVKKEIVKSVVAQELLLKEAKKQFEKETAKNLTDTTSGTLLPPKEINYAELQLQ